MTGEGDLPDGFEHWLIKFSPKGDPEVGQREYDVYRKACAVGIVMSECRLYESDGVKHFFSVDDPARFDWENRHALSVNGKFSAITDADLLTVGEKYGLGTAKRVLAEVKAACA